MLDDVKQRFTNLIDREILLAYAGGLIDGEGCIGIYYNSVNHNYQLRISVEMVHKDGLEILDKLFGGRWYNQAAKQPRRARYKWMIFNLTAANALKELLPYLYVKKEHANVALTGCWDAFRGGKTLSQEEIKIRESIHGQMKKLNKRGFFETKGIN